MLKPTYPIEPLPLAHDFNTVPVLKALVDASQALAELKGMTASIPNQDLLIHILVLQEAKDSSAIENIVTTHDELFTANLDIRELASPAAKEVARYRNAVMFGFGRMKATGGLITNNLIIEMYRMLKMRDDGFRKIPGTMLRNSATGAVVYIPPQDLREIEALMNNLEKYINDDKTDDLHFLIRMALIHYQFESIHPFSDGNGRVGRILNVLYLTRTDLLESPILYLSRYIIQNRGDYYHFLQTTRMNGAWADWVIYMLCGVADTALSTMKLILIIQSHIADTRSRIRAEVPRRFSQDLLEALFRHPYARIQHVSSQMGISRQTAAKYLDALASARIVEKHRIGRNNYYINKALIQLILDT